MDGPVAAAIIAILGLGVSAFIVLGIRAVALLERIANLMDTDSAVHQLRRDRRHE
ncbi:hypothetical protein [Streptomyces triticagri]|uniref:hypothetical protein n=1 Tax=Streptomyces triticagri TaxID=2293568 RepID=UPI001314EC04|nr:hypothetical protein [Streptomyces triticagri]